MAAPPLSLVVIGGNSAIARHILALDPNARALARSRGQGPRITAIDSYFDIVPEMFQGADAVINCAGLVQGDERELRQVNCELQQALAQKAKAAGVSRYVAIGSFSIFGTARSIARDLAPAPADAYGRSKLKGEEHLAAVQGAGFDVLSVAFPAIVGTNRPGKVERMLRLWQRMGVWPIPLEDISRSMIGAQAAARVLLVAAGGTHTGRVLAADPEPFSYRRAARWLNDDLLMSLRVLPVPRSAELLLKRTLPAVHRSLMADSQLVPDDNFMCEQGLESTLRAELIAAARGNEAP